MPEVDDLTRRARRVEADGDYREALEIYRRALRATHPRGDDDPGEPRLLLRMGDLHARLDERDDAVAAFRRAADLYVERGQVTNAVAVGHKILRLFPDETDCHRLLAGLQAEMGLTAEARESMLRYLEGVDEGDVGVEPAVRAARGFLEEVPDQEVALRAARVLEEADRTGDALDLLRSVWEKRTGQRRPAGEIEKCARRLAPGADIGAWTPQWPAVGGGRRAGRGVGPDGAAPGGAPATGDGASYVEEGDAAGPASGTAEEPESGAEPGDGRIVKRYHRRPSGERPPPADAGEAADPDSAAPEASAGAGGRDGAVAPDRDDPGAARENGDGEGGAAPPETDGAGLRRGLEVLEELLELEPSRPALRGRKVVYARRLGDAELEEQALLELGEVLSDRGADLAARLVYEEILESVNSDSRAASSGLRSVTGSRPDTGALPREPASGGTREGEGAAAGSPASEVDEAFRRLVSRGLDRLPEELVHLQAAGRALAADGSVPWWAHLELGRYLLLRDRPARAARHLATARDRAPAADGSGDAPPEDVLYHLGVAHRRAGDEASARDCFRRLAERDEAFAAAWAAVSS